MNLPYQQTHKCLATCAALARGVAIVLSVSFMVGCATNPNEPGSENWYVQRIQEIEDAKAAGEITEGEYLSLKNQADATRALRLNAVRYNNPGGIFGTVDYH